MAKVKFTAIVADMRNKLNGSVFSRNRGGAYVRTKVTPLNPQTSAQVGARALLTGLAQGFRSLSQEEITSWNGAVNQWSTTDIFGDVVNPTGLALYVRLNANILNAEGTAITTPPAPVGAVAISELQLVASAGDTQFEIAFLPAIVPADHSMYLESTTMLSAGINNANSRFRKISLLGTTTTSPYDAYADQNDKFGPLVVGQKAFVRAKLINKITGEVSQALTASAVVAA